MSKVSEFIDEMFTNRCICCAKPTKQYLCDDCRLGIRYGSGQFKHVREENKDANDVYST